MVELDLFQEHKDGSIFTSINVIQNISKRKDKKSHDHLNTGRQRI